MQLKNAITVGEKEETSEGFNEDVLIQTAYGTLRCPGVYSSTLMTEVTDNAVRFLRPWIHVILSGSLTLFSAIPEIRALVTHVGEGGTTLEMRPYLPKTEAKMKFKSFMACRERPIM